MAAENVRTATWGRANNYVQYDTDCPPRKSGFAQNGYVFARPPGGVR